jgi:hypothetical protein
MAVPSSGQLRLRADIALEVDGSATGNNVSLGTLADTAGFTTPPDTMQEFYGYTACTVPSVTTNSSSGTTINSMTANGNVTSDNGCSITERGFYFGTSSNYASNGKYTVSGTTGSFSRGFGSLNSSTTYYATAYAINSQGETRGSTTGNATTTPITYTGYSTNNYPTVGSYVGNFAFQSVSHGGYGQYLHSQLGWQTDNSCLNGTFTAGTSGSNPSNNCGSNGDAAGFPPDFRVGSTNANSRGHVYLSGTIHPASCCGDNNTQVYTSNASNLYGYQSLSYSAGTNTPYGWTFNGVNGYFDSGCPVSNCTGNISNSYTGTINR